VVAVLQVGRADLFEDSYEEYTVTHVQKHPGYDPLSEDLDVALLRLDRAVPNAQPAALIIAGSDERLDTLLAGQELTVMGYGSTGAGGRLSKKLLAGTVEHVSRAECNAPGSYDGAVTSNMLCARGDGVDHCNGDGGGPLVLRNDRGADFLVGVVSWGIGCGGVSYPGVYVDVSAVRQWVMTEIRNQSSWLTLQR
jgi:secreted trypsin-like serine protease